MNNIGLYIHIPFCNGKCPYCDFYSVSVNDNLKGLYKDAVIRNLRQYQNQKFDTVYFGGGTPILLWKEICEILDFLSDNIVSGAEVTIEANPCCTTKEAICSLKKSGVNRVSFGLQSSVDKELSALGRKHNSYEGANAVITAYNAGINNISADIMLGIPHQSTDTLFDTLTYLTDLPLSHISAYMLKIEEGTPFADKSIILPSDEQFEEYYLKTVDFLTKKGFAQYEISNFSKANCESRHNLKYWRCEEYLGIGPSAHSFYNKKRFAVERDLSTFIAKPVQPTYFTDENPDTFEEWAMLKLRLSEGLDFLTADSKYNISREKILKRLALVPENLYDLNDNRLRLTPEGFILSNPVIGIIIDV